MAAYAAQVSIMDEGIGRIIDTLRETNQYENTVRVLDYAYLSCT